MIAATGQRFDLADGMRAPVLAAFGAGANSTAMLIEMIENGEPVDQVLFADTGDEAPRTRAFIPIFADWLRARGVPFAIVRAEIRKLGSHPPHSGLSEACLLTSTLPSISFGFHSCSLRFKIAPQDQWARSWPLAQRAWSRGIKVEKLIGYDCGKADERRFAHLEGYVDDLYTIRTPLREWGWSRETCEARIDRAGLPQPGKSACWQCASSSTASIRQLPAELLRKAVLMEACAGPRLRTVEGLWRKTVKGMRGAAPKPGSMTKFFRDETLLPACEIDWIIETGPVLLEQYKAAQAKLPAAQRTPFREWLSFFDGEARNGRARAGACGAVSHAPLATTLPLFADERGEAA